MSKVLVDREVLERIVNTNMADYAVIAYQHKEIRAILAQPEEAEMVRDYLAEFAEGEIEARTAIEELIAALSAVTAERDRLLAELERAYVNYNQVSYASTERGKQIDQLRAEVEGLLGAMRQIRYASNNGPVSENNAGCIRRIEQIADAAMAAKEA